MPVFSGYRDQRDQSLHITTDYSRVLAKIVSGEETFSHLDHSDFEIILPVSELQSINIFDRAAYELFMKEVQQS